MVLAAPVSAEASTRCAPSVPCTRVAVTPGFPVAELIADTMPLSVLSVSSILILKLCPPSDTVSVPVPTVASLPPANPNDTSCCACASCVTPMLYVPATALESAVAVKAD